MSKAGPQRFAVAAIATVIVTTGFAWLPTPGVPAAFALASSPQIASVAPPVAPTTTFDNFNRVQPNGPWGTATSGDVWTSNNTSTGSPCVGYTSTVDGQSAVLTGSSGASCNTTPPYLTQLVTTGPWVSQTSWTFTGKIKVSTLNGSVATIGRRTGLGLFHDTNLRFQLSSTNGQVEIGGFGGFASAPVSWSVGTWYSFKWVMAFGDQARLKLWPSAQGEPTGWLITRTDTAVFQTGYTFGVDWDSHFSPITVNFDDFAFGPAPILPNVPPPPGTGDNPPFVNGKATGDPVSSLTGAFSYTHTDLSIPGRGPAIQFARSYNSNDTRVTTLGPGWTHSYNIRLVSPGDGTQDVILIGPQGRSDRYVKAGTIFTAPLGVYRTLVQNVDETYTATAKAQTVWEFDASGLLTQIRDRYGNASNMTYDGTGRLVTVSDPAGRGVLTLAYHSVTGLLISVTDWAVPARSLSFGYDASGRLAAGTRGQEGYGYTYDGTSMRIATMRDGLSRTALTLTYDAQGRVVTQKDARGLATGDLTTFSYIVNPDQTRVTTTTAPTTSFEPSFQPSLEDTYSAGGWLIQRITRPSSADTLTQTFTYDGAGNQTSASDPRGAQTDFCYDVDFAGASIPGAAANLTRTIGPPASPGASRPVTLMQYDAKNNLIRTVSPRGVPSGATVTCATDLSAIDAQFGVDRTYDAAAAKLLAVARRFTDPDAGAKRATTKYEYGDAANPGMVTRVIPPRGNTTGSPDYTYSTVMSYFTTGTSSGLLKDITDAVGNKTTYAYDTAGRLASLVDPLGNATGGVPAEHTTQFTYDVQDRPRTISQPSPVAGGAPLITETRYDPAGNPVFRIDANGQVTGLEYDERNSLFRVTESTAPWTDPNAAPSSSIITEYAYDAGGNATRITRAKSDVTNERVTDYSYDGRGLRRNESQYPAWPSTVGALVTSYTYDADGNQQTLVDPVGRTTTSGYDASNRVTSIDYSDAGTADVGMSYDLDGNRIGMTDGTGSASYVFDESGQLVTATSPGPKVVGYRYDLDGHRAKLIYPDATAVAYTFDKAGQLGSLTDWASRSVTYTYWPDGLVKGAALPDGVAAGYTYDNARRLVDVNHQRLTATISHEAYSIDRAGNVASVTDYVSGLTPVPVWSPAVAVNNVLTADQTRPALVSGADGSLYATWADTQSGDSDIYYSRRDPVSGSWSTSVRVNGVTTGAQTQPAIAVDGAGNVYLLWADARLGATDDDIYFSKRTAATGTWSTSVRVNSDSAGKRQYDPSIAISGSGVAMAAWYDERGGGSKKYIYSARLPAGSSTWSANYQVSSNSTAVKGDAEVAIGGDGTTYAVWRDLQSGNADVWFASLPNNGTTWSANAKISDDPGTAAQDAPDIGIDTAGNLLVVWNDARTSPSQIRVRKRPAGTSIWSASTSLGGSTTNAPAIAVRPDGRAYASWSNGTIGTLTTVWGSEYDQTAGTWSTPEQLTVGTEEAAATAVAFTTGQLAVAYQRRPTAGNYDIYARRKPLAGEESAYGYDSIYRLTSVAGPDGPRSYSYDPVGNRVTRVAGTTSSYVYDRADRLTSAGGVAVTTDANGNITARGSETYAYDQANRLATATVAGTTETYVYDGVGTRFSRQVGLGTPIRYVSDVSGALPTVIDDGTRKFVYGVGLAYAVNGSTLEVYHADRLSSTRAITNASGAVTVAYRTDEWGVPRASSGSSSQPFGYTGEPADGTGLTYLRARYYNPDLGRFMSRDSWFGAPSTPQTLNRFAYGMNGPLTYTDPSGRFVDTIVDIAFIVIDVGGLVFGPPKDRLGNWLALGADVGSAFLPFVTGGGLVARATVKAADHVEDATESARWLDDAARAFCSFTPDTLVATPGGPVPISSIEVGDVVLAWDEATQHVVERTVTAVVSHPDNEIARVTIDGVVITTTPDHPFYTLESGWVEAGLLWPTAHVRTVDGTGVVSSVVREPFAGILWNLTVDDAHTFFVGAGEWLVHNMCPAARGFDPSRTVADILLEKRGSITRAPLPEGSPSWDVIRNMTWAEIEAGAKAGSPGFATIRKLLSDSRFDR